MCGKIMALNWYIVHTHSGFEARVKAILEEKIRQQGLEQYFGRIVVPTEKVVEVVKGARRTSTRKIYPGYILVQMEFNDQTWHLVQSHERVTGFVGGANQRPTPLSDAEAEKIIQQMEERAQKPVPKYSFEKGDHVTITEGPFANFNGIIEEVRPEKGKVRVMVSIFGRATPVELEFAHVHKTV